MVSECSESGGGVGGVTLDLYYDFIPVSLVPLRVSLSRSDKWAGSEASQSRQRLLA